MLAKLAGDNRESWDEYLTQALAAVRFSINETAKIPPYYMLFGRDVVLPIDNLLRPRRKYMGEDHHQLILEQQHKVFTQVRRRIRRAQKRRNDRINKNRKEFNFQVGDPVYYKVHLREGKLDRRWTPFYRIVEQTGPVTYIMWDQVAGKVKRVHASDIKLAELDEWEGAKERRANRRMRRATLVEPEKLETDSEEGEEEIMITPESLERIRRIDNRGSSSLEEGNEADSALKMSSEGSDSWVEEDEIPLAQLKERLETEKASKDVELPIIT